MQVGADLLAITTVVSVSTQRRLVEASKEL